MCLAIPGRIVAIGPEPHLATVDVCGVRRRVNIDLLSQEVVALEDWVLIHVGFAMSRISDVEAQEQLRLLSMLGEDAQAMEELEGYGFA
jgi:hydrogenase expression/formation protein HypC